jgi:hypothetical protein
VWPRGFQEVLAPRFSWHSAHEGGEVVSLTHRPPLPPGMFLVLILTRGWVDSRAMVRSEGDMSLKNPVTPPEIEPGTVWLVAQRLNHYATPGPYILYWNLMKQQREDNFSPLNWGVCWLRYPSMHRAQLAFHKVQSWF